MPNESRPAHRADVRLDIDAGRQPAPIPRADADTPFRVAILGDFSGRGSRGIVETGRTLVNRRPIRVDRDNCDDVLARLAPSGDLVSGGGGPRVALRFAELDDFHPDRLYDELPLFQSLRDLRARLANPRTFQAALEELTGDGGGAGRGAAASRLADLGQPPRCHARR